jgi:hypothetical protein
MLAMKATASPKTAEDTQRSWKLAVPWDNTWGNVLARWRESSAQARLCQSGRPWLIHMLNVNVTERI